MEGFESKYKFYDKRVPIADDNPAVHFDETKCKNCTLCRRACETTQTVLDYYSLERTGDVPVCVPLRPMRQCMSFRRYDGSR